MGEIIQEEKVEEGGKKKPKKHSTNIDMTPMVDLMCLLITFFMLTTAFSKPKVMEITMPEKNDDIPPEQQTKVRDPINIIMSGEDKVYWYIGMADPKKPPLPELIKTDYSKDGIRKMLLQKNKAVFKKVEAINEEYKKGTLKMTTEYLDFRKAELSKMIDEGKADAASVNKKIAEIQDQFNKNDKDLNKEFHEWKIRELKKDKTLKPPVILIKADEYAKYKNIVDIIDEMAICNIAGYAVVDISPVELDMLKTAPK